MRSAVFAFLVVWGALSAFMLAGIAGEIWKAHQPSLTEGRSQPYP